MMYKCMRYTLIFTPPFEIVLIVNAI